MIRTHHNSELFWTAQDKRKFWRVLIVIIGVCVLWLALAGPVHSAPRGKGRVAGAVMLPHPPGCPARLFCGCGASWDIYGRQVRALWLSTAWFKFPRTVPRPNTVAVRRGHVFVLKQHVSGKVWMVNDYNSGNNRSRYHARSIAGYQIVDPRSRFAMAMVK